MTDPLEELRAADAARTPGEWAAGKCPDDYAWEVFPVDRGGWPTNGPAVAILTNTATNEHDAAFIALCGTHMTALLARLRAAEAACEACVSYENENEWHGRPAVRVLGGDGRINDALAKWEELTRE